MSKGQCDRCRMDNVEVKPFTAGHELWLCKPCFDLYCENTLIAETSRGILVAVANKNQPVHTADAEGAVRKGNRWFMTTCDGKLLPFFSHVDVTEYDGYCSIRHSTLRYKDKGAIHKFLSSHTWWKHKSWNEVPGGEPK